MFTGFSRKMQPVLDSRSQNDDEIVFANSAGKAYKYNSCPTKVEFASYLLTNDAKYCNELLYTHTVVGWFAA